MNPALLRFTDPLTLRQIQYIAHAANGLTHDEIAAREYVTAHAVRRSFEEARKRVDAKNITELVALAITVGFVVYEDDGYSPVTS